MIIPGRQIRSLTIVLTSAALQACFFSPSPPLNQPSDAVDANNPPPDGPVPCTPIAAGAVFNQFRNGAVGKINGDDLDDIAIIGKVGNAPHLWIFFGSANGIDFSCPNEQIALTRENGQAWTSLGTVKVDAFSVKDVATRDVVVTGGDKELDDTFRATIYRRAYGGSAPVEFKGEVALGSYTNWDDTRNHGAFISYLSHLGAVRVDRIYWGGSRMLLTADMDDLGFTQVFDHGGNSSPFSIYNAMTESASRTVVFAEESVTDGQVYWKLSESVRNGAYFAGNRITAPQPMQRLGVGVGATAPSFHRQVELNNQSAMIRAPIEQYSSANPRLEIVYFAPSSSAVVTTLQPMDFGIRDAWAQGSTNSPLGLITLQQRYYGNQDVASVVHYRNQTLNAGGQSATANANPQSLNSATELMLELTGAEIEPGEPMPPFMLMGEFRQAGSFDGAVVYRTTIAGNPNGVVCFSVATTGALALRPCKAI